MALDKHVKPVRESGYYWLKYKGEWMVGKVNFAGLVLNRIKLNTPIDGTVKFVHVVDGGYLAIKG